MTGRIILTADDYALTTGVSQAIRMLAAAGRISATGAIVSRPGWAREAEALKPLHARLATGLHLNLTLGTPLGAAPSLTRNGCFRSRSALIAAAHAGLLKAADIRAEINRQLDAFEDGMGVPPDFIDGHEHVHVLPVIRSELLDIAQSRYAQRPLLVRNPAMTVRQSLARAVPAIKTHVLRLLARQMRRDIEAAGFVCNDSFGGVTRFTATPNAVADDFSTAANIEGWRPLVMCHPGFVDAELARLDAITDRRQMEFDALMAHSTLALNAWRPERKGDGTLPWPRSPLELTP